MTLSDDMKARLTFLGWKPKRSPPIHMLWWSPNLKYYVIVHLQHISLYKDDRFQYRKSIKNFLKQITDKKYYEILK